jgi:hypothetical protein
MSKSNRNKRKTGPGRPKLIRQGATDKNIRSFAFDAKNAILLNIYPDKNGLAPVAVSRSLQEEKRGLKNRCHL